MLLQIDTKIDQPEAQLVLDREKVAMMGLNLSQIGADLSAAVGGNYVNRFSIDGRSYKVIAQLKRGARLTPEQVEDLHVTGPERSAHPALEHRAPRDQGHAALAESLSAAERGEAERRVDAAAR